MKGFPTLKFFGANKKKPLDYSGGRDADSIVTYALKQQEKAVKDRMGGGSSGGSSGKKSGGSSGGGQESKGTGSDKDVYVLEESNFNDLVIGSKDIWLVEFYAPWCGHCKKLEPEWNEAATKLKGQVKLGKVDATVESGLAQRFGVSGYPTIKVFGYGTKSDSSAKPYEAGREAQDIIKYAS